MTRRRAFLAGPFLAASVLASCTASSPGAEVRKAEAAPRTGITFFGDARLGVAYGPDVPGGKPRTHIVAE